MRYSDKSREFEPMYIYLIFLVFNINVYLLSRSNALELIAYCTVIFYVTLSYRKSLQDISNWLTLPCFSFGLYLLMQSPAFSIDELHYEIAYFATKFILIGLVFLIYCKVSKLSALLGFLGLYYADYAWFYIPINFGVGKTPTEFLSIWESLVASIGTIAILTAFSQMHLNNNTFIRFRRLKLASQKFNINTQTMSNIVLICFVMLHFANYFAAGFAKAQLDGGLFSWLNNDTLATVKRAELWGLTVPSFLLDYDIVQKWGHYGNFAVYFGQLATIIVVLVPILIAPLTLFFDLFHVLVGLSAGVWFYKWILVNLVIFYYRKKILTTLKTLNLMQKIVLQSMVLVFFYTSSVVPLGWYEYRQGSIIFAYGITNEGEEDRLHPQFFGPYAFTILSKRTHQIFESGLPSQMAGLSHGGFFESANCERKELVTRDTKEHLSRVTKITKRVLADRNWFSELMFYVQPYHLAAPPINLVGIFPQKKYIGIRYDLMHFCLNERQKVIQEEKKESVMIWAKKKN